MKQSDGIMPEQVTIPHGQQWGYVYLVLAVLNAAVFWGFDGKGLFSSLLMGGVFGVLWLPFVIALVYFVAFLQD
jgi:hypothetical protein